MLAGHVLKFPLVPRDLCSLASYRCSGRYRLLALKLSFAGSRSRLACWSIETIGLHASRRYFDGALTILLRAGVAFEDPLPQRSGIHFRSTVIRPDVVIFMVGRSTNQSLVSSGFPVATAG